VWVLWFCISLVTNDIAYLLCVLIGHLYIVFRKISVQSFARFFN
jgi:hypothetical protein